MITDLVAYRITRLLSQGFWGQESRHGLAGFSVQGFTRLQSWCQPGCVLIRGLVGESPASKSPKVISRIHFLAVVGLTVTFFFVFGILTSGRAPISLLKAHPI